MSEISNFKRKFFKDVIHQHDTIVIYVNFFKSAKGIVDPLNPQLKRLESSIAGLVEKINKIYESNKGSSEFIHEVHEFIRYKQKKTIVIFGCYSEKAIHGKEKILAYQNYIWKWCVSEEAQGRKDIAIIMPFLERRYKYYDFIFSKYPKNCVIIIPPLKTADIISDSIIAKNFAAQLENAEARKAFTRKRTKNVDC